MCRQYGNHGQYDMEVYKENAMTHVELAERRKQIAEWVKQGASMREAANKFGMCVSHVHACCIEHRTATVRRSASIRVVKIIAMLQDGRRTYQSIADALGCSRQAVHQIYKNCKKHGMKLPARKHGG